MKCIPEFVAPYSREEASSIVNNIIYPQRKNEFCFQKGHAAQNIQPDEIVLPSDLCTILTYAEFPLSSFHELVDVAIHQYDTWNDNDDDDEGERNKQRRSLMDLCSGCRRLALYAALTCGDGCGKDDDGDDDSCCYYDVHGIEI
eukprot:10187479-Ditylum_brightwellii.AAC.1